jgi:hypothetical protein
MRLTAVLSLCLLLPTAVAGDEPKPEPGFKLLTGAKTLDGWKTKTKAKDAEGEPLDGKAEAFGGRFRLADGVLTIDPKVKGDVIIETAKAFEGDAVIRFEFLPGEGCNNDLFFRGQKFDLNPKQVKPIKVGDWNEFEITVAGSKAEFKCNGEVVRAATLKAGDKGTPFGIRAEFGPIQFRKLRVKAGE